MYTDTGNKTRRSLYSASLIFCFVCFASFVILELFRQCRAIKFHHVRKNLKLKIDITYFSTTLVSNVYAVCDLRRGWLVWGCRDWGRHLSLSTNYYYTYYTVYSTPTFLFQLVFPNELKIKINQVNNYSNLLHQKYY